MNKAKILAGVLSAAVVLAVTGCGGENYKSEQNGQHAAQIKQMIKPGQPLANPGPGSPAGGAHPGMPISTMPMGGPPPTAPK